MPTLEPWSIWIRARGGAVTIACSDAVEAEVLAMLSDDARRRISAAVDEVEVSRRERPGRGHLLEFRSLLEEAMGGLAARRPLFHSEADFQLALAWTIQVLVPEAEIRLERRVLSKPVVALDLLVTFGGRTYAVALKYLKASLDVKINREPFHLATRASDVERYDFLRDIVRLERLVGEGVADAGFAVLLTNAPAFWRPGTGRVCSFDAFRIHEGRTLEGILDWGPTAGAGTRRGREEAIVLKSSYECHWQPYSKVAAGPGGELRYLAVEVGGAAPNSP